MLFMAEPLPSFCPCGSDSLDPEINLARGSFMAHAGVTDPAVHVILNLGKL